MAALILQSAARRAVAGGAACERREAVVLIQSGLRRALAMAIRRELAALQMEAQAATRLQKAARGMLTRFDLRLQHVAAALIAAHFKGRSAHAQYTLRKLALETIQRVVRGHGTRRARHRRDEAILCVQAFARARLSVVRAKRHKATRLIQAMLRRRTAMLRLSRARFASL